MNTGLVLAFTPGLQEILLLLLVILILFGAKRLPELSRSLGRSLSEFKRGKTEGEKAANKAVDELKTDSDEKKEEEQTPS